MKIDAHMHLTIPTSMMVEQLKSLGFDHGVVCSSAVARGECIQTLDDARVQMGQVVGVQNSAVAVSVEDINAQIAAAVATCPEMLFGFGKVDLFQENPGATIAQIAQMGMKGVGEIVGIHGNVERLCPILEAAGQYKLPVFLHTDYPVDSQDLQGVFALAVQYPQTQIILGHMGGDFWIDAIAGAAKTPNVWVDTSEVVNQVALQVAVNEVGDRLLFSTDYPWDAPESMVARVEALHNTDAQKQAVMGDNAARLFGL